MKINILLPFLFLLFGCENDVKPLWLSGLWKGTFKDTHTSTDPATHFVDQPAYPVELSYMVSTNSGTIFYPSLGCKSNWAYLKKDNDTLFFEEKIVSGQNQLGCVDKMNYKLMQLSKNEIAIIGNGIAINGNLIETKGILTKAGNRISERTQPNASELGKNNPPTDNRSDDNSNQDFHSIAKISSSHLIKDEASKLVGTWECTTYETGNKCFLLWKLNKNKTYKFYWGCNSREKIIDGTWDYKDGIFINNGIRNSEKITCNDNDSFTLTVLTENSDVKYGTKRIYKKTNKSFPIIENIQMMCPVCKGDKKVVDGVGVDGSCWTPAEHARYTSDAICVECPAIVLVRCCYCKGAGWVSN